MPSLMPSLLKYFTVVGGILFAGLIGMNALMEQGGPGPRLVKDMPKVVVQVDPHASKVERLRAQEAALQAAEKANPQAHPVIVTEPLRLPPEPAAQPVEQPTTQVAAKPVQAAQPMSSMPAAATAPEREPARPVQTAHDENKHRVAAEKPRKKRIARERIRPRATQEASAASRQQDQIYYSYAPRPTYGPFAQSGWQSGGFGGGWGRAW
jgi:hypothetical protein